MWKTVDSPISTPLYDVVSSQNGPVAVGSEGYVIGRSADGSWGIVLDNGPGARGRSLHAAATTDDGKRIWFAGASGAFGYYDIPDRRRRDFSRPLDSGNTLHAVTVEGTRGNEKFLIADGSGHVVPGDMKDGRISWDEAQKPNSGDSIASLAAADGVGYAVDSNSNVWETTSSGWQRVGVNAAQKSFYAVHADSKGIVVGGGDGRVYTSETGHGWTPFNLGEFTVHALARKGKESLAAGESGAIYYRKGKNKWVDCGWDGDETLESVHVGDQLVAVGQNGVIVERQAEESESKKRQTKSESKSKTEGGK